MPVYNSIISRTDAAALIPEDVSREIIQGAKEQSAILAASRRVQDMPRAQRRLPVLSVLPVAYFVTGDNSQKQTSEVNWDDKFLDAEEIAVIVPIPEAVLDDADYDIWAEVRPAVSEAFGKTIDAAIMHGTNAPTSWPDDLQTDAAAAGNSVDLSTIVGAGGDLYDAILGEDGSVGKIELDGFMASGHIAAMTMRAKLRGLRDSNGQVIFSSVIQEATRYQLDGEPVAFPRNGALDATAVLMFSGDWTQLIYSFRQDMTFKILTEAVIQDGAGNIIYNLAQQDMVALRAVMRLAWQVPNPINRLQETEASRYPFAILVP